MDLGGDPIAVAATVQALWRYPVNSLLGERVQTLSVTADGVVGDRGDLLVDLASGEIAAPENVARWRPALQLDARIANGEVLVSSKSWSMRVDDSELDIALADHFGFRCAIRRAGSRLCLSTGDFVLRPRYEASPLHIVFGKSLHDLSELLPEAVIDVRRFRPNIVVETTADESDWIDRQIALGSCHGKVVEKTKRCGMTMIAQTGLPEDAEILRAIVKRRQRCFGVYADVASAGVIAIGDPISVSQSHRV